MLGRFKSLAPKAAYIDACRRAHEYIEYYIRQALEDSSLHKVPPRTHEPHRKQRSMVQGLAVQTDDMEFIRSQILQGMLAAQETIPVFPMLGRTCLQDTTLPVGGGQNQDQPIFVAKGTFVVTSYIAMHMDDRVFGKSPELFRPSCWNEICPSQWEYMPFGGGERACLGREKVMAEAAYVVARLAQTFARVESRDDRPWKEQVRMTAKNANGCKVGLSQR